MGDVETRVSLEGMDVVESSRDLSVYMRLNDAWAYDNKLRHGFAVITGF